MELSQGLMIRNVFLLVNRFLLKNFVKNVLVCGRICELQNIYMSGCITKHAAAC